MDTTTATDAATTAATQKAKLSCNHVQEVGPAVRLNDRVSCEKCEAKPGALKRRTRRVKTLTPLAPSAADQAEATEPYFDPAEGFAPESFDTGVDHGPATIVRTKRMRAERQAQQPDPAEVMVAIAEAELAAGHATPAKLAKAVQAAGCDHVETLGRVGNVDAAQASAEWKALKEWAANGPTADTVPNIASLVLVNCGQPGKAAPADRKAARQGTGTPRRNSPRRAEANAEQKRLNGRRGPGKKVTREELEAYIANVRAEFPDAHANDELEVAYWLRKLAVSRKVWNEAWAAVSEG